MRTETIYFIVICLALVAACWYFGWLNEVYLFGANVLSTMLEGHEVIISADDTAVAAGEHAYKLLTEVTLPNSITTVGQNAFKSNLITKITIGSDVTLEKNAFGHGFEAYYISNNRFSGTYTRKDIKSSEWTSWKNGFAYTVQNNSVTIFDYSGSAGDIIIPAEINGEAVTTITKRAFFRKGLTGVTIPHGIKEIEVDAFEGNLITRIVIPPDITLGDDGKREDILGFNSGFNAAYHKNKNERDHVYTRRSADSSAWSVSNK